eukprot:GHVN01051382.1.p1 GENE.GHVN01051382.1~~GHVN01051382.1.p1  ORF type:complete len:672 (+),score=109.10 GHVN01051382.1:768-2783(+)
MSEQTETTMVKEAPLDDATDTQGSDSDPGPMPAPPDVDNGEDSESDDGGLGPVPVKQEEAPLTQAMIKRRKKTVNEKTYLENIPCAQMYELSYMHRDTIVQVLSSNTTEFIITGSVDGRVKFWKKGEPTGIEPRKEFLAHKGELLSMSLSPDGLLLGTVGKDKSFKLFDVVAFDMMHIGRLSFTPLVCCFVHTPGAVESLIAISDSFSPNINIFSAMSIGSKTPGSGEGCMKPIRVLERHSRPVHSICFNPMINVAVSADPSGCVEMWHPDTFGLPTPTSTKGKVRFDCKTDTDLYEFMKSKTYPLSLTVSPNGEYLACLSHDYLVRVFRFSTGKKMRVYDESLEMHSTAQSDPHMEAMRLDELDFGRRLAVEKELRTSDSFHRQRCVFDESSHFICYPTMVGIKVVSITSNQISHVLGKAEIGERFLDLSLIQCKPQKSRGAGSSASTYTTGDGAKVLKSDPTFIATAYKKKRFYMFTLREPTDGLSVSESRDVFNEVPTKEEQQAAVIEPARLGKEATIHTTMGDIRIKLFHKEVPKTVENFTELSKKGYYDTHLFHRVIKGFMAQTGDPNGDGSGGESIWGGEFEDEFHRSLKHDRPFMVSMANCGKNTNGSQFFITTVPCPWLDNKHTVFGRVVQGMDVVTRLENVRTNQDDKPYTDVRIMTIKINS